MNAPNYVVEFMRNRQMPMDVDTYCRCNFTRATPTSEKAHSLFLTIQSRIGDMPYTSIPLSLDKIKNAFGMNYIQKRRPLYY